MRKFIFVLSFLFIFNPATWSHGHLDTENQSQNQIQEKMDISLDDFRWNNRLLVVFAPDRNHNQYKEQMEEFAAFEAAMKERNLLIVSVLFEGSSDIDGKGISETSADLIKARFGETGSDFSVILIGKDGTKKMHENGVVSRDSLFRIIDRMPMRQREIRKNREKN